jgi:glycosyltransferase involved in cell wall biosynthesis
MAPPIATYDEAMNGPPTLTFVNYPLETFTPTQSGAIATVIHECCRSALAIGLEPWVISRQGDRASFDWPRLIELHGPAWHEWRQDVAKRATRKATGMERPEDLVFGERAARAIESRNLHRTSILILHNSPELAVYLWWRLRGPRIVHHFHNQHTTGNTWRSMYRRLPIVTTGVSRFTANWVAAHYRLPSVDVVYNGVDHERFAPVRRDQARTVTVGFVGRTGREKAPDLLLSAALLIARDRSDFRLQIVGSNHWDRFELDDYQRELQSQATQLRRLGVEVRFIGHVDRAGLPSRIADTDIQVVPSRWDEPCALTLFEAMSCGLPLVASATGGTPEVVGGSGLLFPRDDAEALADLLRMLLDHPEIRGALGESARRRARRFAWSETLQGFLDAASRSAGGDRVATATL